MLFKVSLSTVTKRKMIGHIIGSSEPINPIETRKRRSVRIMSFLPSRHDGVVDRKLVYHVRKFLDSKSPQQKLVQEEELCKHLLDTHLEYRRKQQIPFRKAVGKALQDYMSEKENEPLKRQREEIKLTKNDSNMLNKNLCKSYASTSKEKEENPESSIKKPKKRERDRDRDRVLHEVPTKPEIFGVARPSVRYSDMGGIEDIISDIRELIEYPLTHPEIYRHLGVEPPRGILLHGPPGTGKTMLANAIAGETGAYFIRVSAPEIVSGMSGESEQKLRSIFNEAIVNAPSIIFIDEIDAITPKRETSQRGMDKRIVAQLLTSADSLSLENTNGHPVVLIGATNRPDSLDSALRRAGRFDREICVGIPDDSVRLRILQVLCEKMHLAGDFDLKEIAKRTPGFVGADLLSLSKEAAVVAVNRVFSNLLEKERQTLMNETTSGGSPNIVPFSKDQLEDLFIQMEDFFLAIPKVQPSSRREGFATIPDATWQDVGGLADIREELLVSIVHPLRFPERFKALGLDMPAGVLLYGPPGCGKTMLAKAVANESRANFISIKGPELLDKYVGESEKAVRQLFQRANASAPCIVFFDELDALCPRRGGGDKGNNVTERVVNQLLTEMDGLESRRSVFVIAATNRPDIIDPAMLRPGRLDKLLYVPLPTVQDRLSILRTAVKKTPLADDIDLDAIASDTRCEGYSGADLAALVREAGISALKGYTALFESISNDTVDITLKVQRTDFEKALNAILPSVSSTDQRLYDRLKSKLRSSRSTLNG